METVSFLSDALTLFLHLSKEKGTSGSRDGWYPGLITTNASLQNKFEEERATVSYSSKADAMPSSYQNQQVVAQKASRSRKSKTFILHLYFFHLNLIIDKNTEKGMYLVNQESFSSNI